MLTGTNRRLVPEIALVVATAIVVAVLLTRVGGKAAADTGAVAWLANQEMSCSGAAGDLAEAGRIARENSAAAARLSEVPTAAQVDGLVTGAERMAEEIRQFSIGFRSHAVPAEGVDPDRVERIAAHANALATAWDGLAAEYGDLEGRPGSVTTERIADWTLRADGAAAQLARVLSDLHLRTCVPLAQSMSPQA